MHVAMTTDADGDPKAVWDATRSFLDDRSDAESALEGLLETDAAHDTWGSVGLDGHAIEQLKIVFILGDDCCANLPCDSCN